MITIYTDIRKLRDSDGDNVSPHDEHPKRLKL